MPELFERVEVFKESGEVAGYVLRRCRFEPGTAYMPYADQHRETVALIKEAEDAIRYD